MLIIESRLCECGLVTVWSFQFSITFKNFPNNVVKKFLFGLKKSMGYQVHSSSLISLHVINKYINDLISKLRKMGYSLNERACWKYPWFYKPAYFPSNAL